MQGITEDITGVQDGVNTTFTTSGTYVPTTVRVYLNGQMLPKDFVVESGGTSFEVCDPFESDDDVQVRYTSVL